MTHTGYIYCIENNFDDSIYIGSTIRSIHERFLEHVSAAKKNPKTTFHLFMKEHGIDNFSVSMLEQLENITIFELRNVEESYIRDYSSLNTTNGTNEPNTSKSDNCKVHSRKIQTAEKINYSVTMDQIKEKTSNLKYKLEIDEFIGMFMDEDIDYGKAIEEFTTNNKVHLSAMLLECLGYEGTYNKQQYAIKRFLKSNRINYSELSSDDPNIEMHPTIKEEMKNMKPNAIACRKWLIIEPREFKKVIMKLNTKNGDNIREYYIKLEELIKLYLEYSLYFKEREAQIEKQKSQFHIETLEKKLDEMKLEAEKRHDELLDKVEEVQYDLNIVGEKLDIAVEDRAPKVKAELLRERFIILNRNDRRASCQYYVMRGQDHYINGKILMYKNLHPNLEIIFDISCQPNPRNLFVRFKELKDNRFKVIGNNIQTLDEEALLELFNKLNEDKRNIQLI